MTAKVKIKIKIKVKGDGQECPSHTGKGKINFKGSGRGRPLYIFLSEFEAVGLVEEVPGFAVGVVFVAFAASFGVEGERGQAEDVREWEDVPGIFGNDVGGEEI